MPDWLDRLTAALTAPYRNAIDSRVREALKVYDDQWWTRIGAQDGTDTLDPDSPLRAYYENPLAFRIVNLT